MYNGKGPRAGGKMKTLCISVGYYSTAFVESGVLTRADLVSLRFKYVTVECRTSLTSLIHKDNLKGI
jgi:hypothetical protein